MAIKIEGFDTASGSPISGGLVYKGSYDAATNTPILTSSSKGDFYIVSVAGTLAGVTLNVGDHIVFNQNASSPITASMFDVIDNTDSVTSVNTQVGAVVLDTDDISETATNQYFTAARFDTQLATKDTDDISEGVSNLYFTSPRFTSELATKTTDNLTEGVSNLYYTNTRFDNQFSTKTTDNLTEGVINLYYTNARFDTQLATKDTDDISEGATNQYFTNTRADARIAAANLTDLNDVDYTAGAGIDGRVLTYVNANSRWEAVAPSAGGGGFTYSAITSASSPVTGVIEYHYSADTSAGAITIDLPAIAAGNSGKEIRVKLKTAGNNLVLSPNGTDQVEAGGAGVDYTLTVQNTAITLVSDGSSNWEII